MNLLRKILLGVALATVVTGSMVAAPTEARADTVFLAGPFFSEAAADAYLAASKGWQGTVNYYQNSPNGSGPGFYIVQ